MSNQPNPPPRISEAARKFLEHARVELQFGAQTLEKYQYCLSRLQRALGDRPVTEITADDITGLKSQMLARGNGVCWQVVMLAAPKRLLMFCRDRLGLNVLDPAAVVIPKRPRREVVYLTPDEVERFVRAIPLTTSKNQPHRPGLRFRALVEALLGSAMRIGEVLSLNRADIDFERKEARVIGKGNKERTVFFTDRALHWISRYLEIRGDSLPALFASQGGETRLSRTDIWRPFHRYRRLAGLNKPVRPHLLRHTAATQLLFNGCPVGHIKEILGHERLETTCRYYLGLDRRAAKLAHQRYLVYEPEPNAAEGTVPAASPA
ncbi:MAG: tyrosine-type recombinase/integrase [Bryobacteraceae bacterium]|jgi:integrase/recombinase XerD